MRRHGFRPDGLIETLHVVQEHFGYLSPESLEYVAAGLGVPLSRAHGVATFYHLFTLHPHGAHTCTVCLGTACYLNGGPALLRSVRERCGVEPGETTPDGRLTLLTARCVGACSMAPLVQFGEETVGWITEEALLRRLESLESHEP